MLEPLGGEEVLPPPPWPYTWVLGSGEPEDELKLLGLAGRCSRIPGTWVTSDQTTQMLMLQYIISVQSHRLTDPQILEHTNCPGILPPPPDPFVSPRFPENLGEALEVAKRHQGLTLALLLGILLYLAIAIYISLWVSRVITERLVKKTSWCRGSAVFAPKRLRMHGGVGVFVLALWPICGTNCS